MEASQIYKLLNDLDECRYDYNVWVVANVLDTVQNSKDFVIHTNFSEFFTKAEFASIISAITSVFGYVRTFYSEIELIEFILKFKTSLDFSKVIIYNFARDGINEGKKSLVPSFCNLFGIKYTGSNPFVISLLRNKFIYSKYLESMGIPTPKTLLYSEGILYKPNSFAYPKLLIVKNNCEAASLGMTENNIVKFDNNMNDFINTIHILSKEMCSKQLILQEFIDGCECEVFTIKYKGSYHAFMPIELLIRDSKIITDSISNSYNYTFRALSERYSESVCTKIKETTESAARILNIGNYARFDYRINYAGEPFLIDIAGTPYLTRHSSIAYLFTNVLKLEYEDIFKLIAAVLLN